MTRFFFLQPDRQLPLAPQHSDRAGHPLGLHAGLPVCGGDMDLSNKAMDSEMFSNQVKQRWGKIQYSFHCLFSGMPGNMPCFDFCVFNIILCIIIMKSIHICPWTSFLGRNWWQQGVTTSSRRPRSKQSGAERSIKRKEQQERIMEKVIRVKGYWL